MDQKESKAWEEALERLAMLIAAPIFLAWALGFLASWIHDRLVA